MSSVSVSILLPLPVPMFFPGSPREGIPGSRSSCGCRRFPWGSVTRLPAGRQRASPSPHVLVSAPPRGTSPSSPASGCGMELWALGPCAPDSCRRRASGCCWGRPPAFVWLSAASLAAAPGFCSPEAVSASLLIRRASLQNSGFLPGGLQRCEDVSAAPSRSRLEAVSSSLGRVLRCSFALL